MTFQTHAELLLKSQTENWPLAEKNYDALNRVRTREFHFGDTVIRIQHNPARAVSSLAKTDAQSLAARPCFLCSKNRPEEQQGIAFLERYDLLVNPFPIFPRHFTIVSRTHEPQLLSESKFDDLLEFARLMPDYYLFYNGARAGASAPDHFHFQAGNADFFPQPPDALSLPFLCTRNLKTADKETARQWFERLKHELEEKKTETEAGNGGEPLFNLFVRHANPAWTLTLFPRRAHRPAEYHSGELLISPGAVDMGGVLIAAREEDFLKITDRDIRSIYTQTSLIL